MPQPSDKPLPFVYVHSIKAVMRGRVHWCQAASNRKGETIARALELLAQREQVSQTKEATPHGEGEGVHGND
jgi:hypothetical protein